MEYVGRLFGKVPAGYIPLEETTEDVEKLRRQLPEYKDALFQALKISLTSGTTIEAEGYNSGLRTAMELIDKVTVGSWGIIDDEDGPTEEDIEDERDRKFFNGTSY